MRASEFIIENKFSSKQLELSYILEMNGNMPHDAWCQLFEQHSSKNTYLTESLNHDLVESVQACHRAFSSDPVVGESYIIVPVSVFGDVVQIFDSNGQFPAKRFKFNEVVTVRPDSIEFNISTGKPMRWPTDRLSALGFMTCILIDTEKTYDKFRSWCQLKLDVSLSPLVSDSVNEEAVDEMALKQFTPMGDFNKPGPFKGVDKRLVPHPTNQIKTQKFLEQTPYDFRLFFSNIPGTGKYSETGPVSTQQLQQMFGDQAEQISKDSEDAITVVFVGNSGDSKVMMTPWIMAHRFGHAIQAGVRGNSGWNTWKEAEKHFFTAVNSMLAEYYGKQSDRRGGMQSNQTMQTDLTPEYNALFNAIGTQRSSRSGEIKRPYEFLYEIFAQYLGTGQVTFNPLPGNLGYGRKNWGNPSKYLNLKQEYRNNEDAADATQTLANDMRYMFDDVLSSSVGKIFVM